MKVSYGLLAGFCLVASVPLVVLLLNRRSAVSIPVARFATFNVALNRAGEGQLLAELQGGKSEQARRIAEIVQRVAPDVLFVCELDRDHAFATATVLAREYLAVSQHGQPPVDLPFCYAGEVNTGEPSGLDLDGDGRSDGPGDAFGFGAFPGQYGMALLSRHPILHDGIRTFRLQRWSTMPGALRPEGRYGDEAWQHLRLSSKSHWDVPIGVGKQVVHVLCCHPTPPVFDGPEDSNGCRNHDEIRFWVDYLTPGADAWIVDDAGRGGGLPAGEPFVLLGDLNCDPQDGDGRRAALSALLQHPRVQDPQPGSAGGEAASRQQWRVNATHKGEPVLDTSDFPDEAGAGPGNLRVDYVLLARELRAHERGVYWPLPAQAGGMLVTASDHRLVFVDVEAH